MKKILLLMFLCTISICAKAQEADSLQTKTNISIEELAAKLEKLQHDYDFLYCRSELDRVCDRLDNVILDIRIETNNIISACYNHNKADIDFYISSMKLYNQNKESFGIHKFNAEMAKGSISLRMLVSNFSEAETEILNSSLALLDNKLTYIEKLFDSYKEIIDTYKEK